MSGAEILLQCGECSGPVTITSVQTVGLAPCACGSGADVGHAFAHAPWCRECGEDLSECACEHAYVCDLCGAECGLVCRACLSCPEPAGYWAWDWTTSQDYLVTLERAAAHESDTGVKRVMMAHHALMVEALGMQEEGE
jgi:hypothetical protein